MISRDQLAQDPGKADPGGDIPPDPCRIQDHRQLNHQKGYVMSDALPGSADFFGGDGCRNQDNKEKYKGDYAETARGF
jgi:hypothetical protein